MPDRILIIEGESSLSKEATSVLTEAGFSVACVPDYPEVLLELSKFKPDLVILDEVLRVKDDIEARFEFYGIFGIPVILLGRDFSGEMWERLMEAEADLYETKHFSHRELVARVNAILQRYKKVAR